MPKKPKYAVSNGAVTNLQGGHFDPSGSFVTGKGKTKSGSSKAATRFAAGAAKAGFPAAAQGSPFTSGQYDQFFGTLTKPGGQAALQTVAGKAQAPPNLSPPPANAGVPGAAPSYQGALNAQFGAGNPFGMAGGWGGKNPLDTAQALAQQNLGQSLADIRARYGASGMGNSGREALAEGTAAAQMGTQLGDVLAGRGQQQAQLGLNAMLGAGGLQNQAAGLSLQGAQGLGNLGQFLTSIGAGEQSPANMNALMNLMNMWSNFQQQGNFAQTSDSQSGFLAD